MTVQDTRYEDTPLPMPDLDSIPAEYAGMYEQDLVDLFDTWHSVRSRNERLTQMYTMHNAFEDIGVIDIPDRVKMVREVVGWPYKAVDVMAVRSIFDGYVTSGRRDPMLTRLYKRNSLGTKYRRACRETLTHGIANLTVMRRRGSDEPIVRSYSANQSSVLWDKDEERVACGIALTGVDRDGKATRYVVFEPDVVLSFERVGERTTKRGKHISYEWECKVEPNPVGVPLMVPLIFDPDDDRPLGHSRITPEVISITNKAMRDVMNMDIAAAFWTFPQRYLLGVDKTIFRDNLTEKDIKEIADENGPDAVARIRTRMETYFDKFLAISRDDSNQVPTVGQFDPMDVDNLIRTFENDAQRFSGATNVPLGQLGVLSNTYTSSDALGAANDPLILQVETMNRDNAVALEEVARLAMCIERDVSYDELGDDAYEVEAYFPDPSQPTIAARADAWTKIGSADPELIGTDVWYEGLGLPHATIERIKTQKETKSVTDMLIEIASTTTDVNQPNVTDDVLLPESGEVAE